MNIVVRGCTYTQSHVRQLHFDLEVASIPYEIKVVFVVHIGSLAWCRLYLVEGSREPSSVGRCLLALVPLIMYVCHGFDPINLWISLGLHYLVRSGFK